ncbi:RNA polymerase, sigma 54 subunit, RpoN [sediment metagenome]|uniref:RNA polymerase, sigma 54 subunit, RpoN n=1 Tax=sediment metagenome TaxID=749907 RepID=D9PLR2_9ZZZZ
MQLEQRIKKELEENPALEEGEDEVTVETQNDQDEENIEVKEGDEGAGEDNEFSFEDYLGEDDTPDYRLNTSNYSKDDKFEEIPFSVGSSFQEFLESQLGLRVLTEREKMLATYLIGNIDEDGYLRRKLEAIVDDIAFSLSIKTDEVELRAILDIIQDFDPPGTGARDLQECLLLQIRKRDLDDPYIINAHEILKFHFDEFTKKHYDKILNRMDISEEDLKGAIDEILKLNPKPGGSYSDPLNKTFEQIVPDFILENNDGELELSLNSRNIPELRVSRTYNEMLQSFIAKKDNHSRTEKEAISFVKQKLDSAKWFIDAIRQRQNTLLITMHTILAYQKEYFIEGDERKMRPMILKDIADLTGLDISTISRVANSKYIQTHFGIFPLKYFFSEGLQTDSGEEVSTREIKKILQECVENEDKRKPVTDEKLTDILQEKGYQIARRTVAKYREQLGIPVARLRKEL